jgi:hypothetical protein
MPTSPITIPAMKHYTYIPLTSTIMCRHVEVMKTVGDVGGHGVQATGESQKKRRHNKAEEDEDAAMSRPNKRPRRR